MNNAKILVTSTYKREVIAPHIELLRSNGNEVDLCSQSYEALSEQELAKAIGGYQIIIAGGEIYSEEVLKAASDLELIVRDGVGVDCVDLEAATENGVMVINSPVVHEAVADLAFGLMISATREILQADKCVRQGLWDDRDLFLTDGVFGKTLGLIGFGRIGQGMARRAQGFNMTVIAYDPYANKEVAETLGVKMVEFEELMSNCDILSIHVPNTNETRKLVDGNALRLMKDGAYLINTARGAVVDQKALVEALKEGKLRGAALDVFDPEPPEASEELLKMNNVVLTPHMGSDTEDSFSEVFKSAVNNSLTYLEGGVLDHLINPEVLDNPRFRGRVKRT